MARRHVLIGGGAGALAAAETIREADPGAQIEIVCADPHGYYSRPGLAYYLAREVPEKGLFPFTPQDLASLRVTVLIERGKSIDRAAHRVTLESGRELPYDRLLVATGSRAIPTKVPGAELDGVVKLDQMDDARDLIRRCRTAKTAVVVGGGITALEMVEGLRARRVHVHYFMRKDRYWSNVLSESESRIVEQALLREHVEIHPYTDLAAILGRNGRVAAVETGDGTTIPCDLVGVAIGVRPRIELAEAAGLACGRGILVDQYLRSSDPDIFAAGDVAEVYDARTGHRTLDILWNTAVAKGRVAGRNMAATPVDTYEEGTPHNATRLAGLHATIIGTVGSGEDADLEGIARGDSQIWSELCEAAIVEAQRGDAHIRLALDEGVIVGAVVIGDQALSFPLQELIEARVDVSGVEAALEAPEAPIVELVNGAWRDWKAQLA